MFGEYDYGAKEMVVNRLGRSRINAGLTLPIHRKVEGGR